MEKHFPVMLDEVIDILNIKPDGVYVDLTVGYAGHSAKILKKLKNGLLIGFDKDKQAIEESHRYLLKINDNFKLIHSDYKDIKNQLTKIGINQVDGIIADLGVSSPQLDEANRGFSYNKNSILDMRMNQEQKLNAKVIVNNYDEEMLVKIFRNFADVKLPKRVAKGIISNRPIISTLELVNVIRKSLPAAIVRKKHPAKTVFQALRIAVNNELESLKKMLSEVVELLNKDGKIGVITFHSIEDKIVKNFFKSFTKDDSGKLPIIIEKKYSTKTIKPSKQELLINKRSRSAKLRVLKKI